MGNWTVGFGVSESEFIVYYPKTTKQQIGIAHFKKQVDLTLTSWEFQIEVMVHSPHSEPDSSDLFMIVRSFWVLLTIFNPWPGATPAVRMASDPTPCTGSVPSSPPRQCASCGLGCGPQSASWTLEAKTHQKCRAFSRGTWEPWLFYIFVYPKPPWAWGNEEFNGCTSQHGSFS